MILSGKKTIEFRSMLPKDFKSGDKIYLYETSKNGGSKKIVGECEVDYIINVLSKDGKWPTFGCYPFLEYYFQNIKNDSYVANQYGKIKSEFENKVTKYKHGYVVKYAFSEENLDSLRKHGEVIDLWNIANFTVVQKYLKDIEKSEEYLKECDEWLTKIGFYDETLESTYKYGIVLKNIMKYDKPKEISDFIDRNDNNIKKAPQSWMYTRGCKI
jgi:predicted transcriptional regulator